MALLQRLLRGRLQGISVGHYQIQGTVWDDRSSAFWEANPDWKVSLDITLNGGGLFSFNGAFTKQYTLPAAVPYVEPGDEWQVGWPEPLLLIQREGAIRYGYGCLFHFRKRLELAHAATLEQVSLRPRQQDSEVVQEFEFVRGSTTERFELQPGDVWEQKPYELKVEHAEEVRGVTGAQHWYKMELRT